MKTSQDVRSFQTPSELRAWQDRKLRRFLLKTVFQHSPYYSEWWKASGLTPKQFRGTRDLSYIPSISKEDLTASSEGVRRFVLQPDPHQLKKRPDVMFDALRHGKHAAQRHLEEEFRPIFMTSTSGRSAEPVPFVFSKDDLDRLRINGRFLCQVLGSSPEDRILNCFPYAPHLAFWQVVYAAEAFDTFQVASGGGATMGTHGNMRLLAKLKPQALIGMPTFLYHVLQVALEEGVSIPSVTKVVLGGEKVPPGTRRKLAHMLRELGSENPNVLATYGFTEARMAWAECHVSAEAGSTGYHIHPELGYIEVIDPETGEVLPEETPGEIVFTPLDGRASVVLRYRTGDLIGQGVTTAPCPHCGRVCQRLLGTISRTSNIQTLQLGKLKGTLIDFNRLEHLLDDEDQLGAWCLELRKVNDDPMEVDQLLLHLQVPDSLQTPEYERHLRNRFREEVEIKPNEILYHSPAEMREMQGVGREIKETRLLDHRPKEENVA